MPAKKVIEIVLDVETTGLDYTKERMVEFAGLRLENGKINYFVVEPKKFLKKINIYNNETCIKLEQIVKIGEDVILVDLH